MKYYLLGVAECLGNSRTCTVLGLSLYNPVVNAASGLSPNKLELNTASGLSLYNLELNTGVDGLLPIDLLISRLPNTTMNH